MMMPIKQNMILGSLVADAATMGLHWIYDQQRILDVGDKDPTFITPNQQHYQGVMSFFAHRGKQAGDLSLYGEQTWLMLSCLAEQQGQFNRSLYQQKLRQHFGYGGQYQGYVDKPTTETLDNITITEYQVRQQASKLNYLNDQQTLLSSAIALCQQQQELNLTDFKQHLTEQKAKLSDQQIEQLFKTLQPLTHYPGSFDAQLPAMAKLPTIIACCGHQSNIADIIESPIKVTNNHPDAIAYGHVVSQMLLAASQTQNINDTIDAGYQAATDDIKTKIDHALASDDKTTPAYTQEIGMSCELSRGIPTVFHLLKQNLSYSETIKQNIIAGGDNCGRAVVIGSLLAAIYGQSENGIPQAWIDKLNPNLKLAELFDAIPAN